MPQNSPPRSVRHVPSSNINHKTIFLAMCKLAHTNMCFVLKLMSFVEFYLSDNTIFQVRTSRIGYYTLNEDLTIASNTERHAMIQKDMVISPRLSLRGSDDMYRIVLTWGRSPKDLDSYLITPWPREPDCQSGMVSLGF